MDRNLNIVIKARNVTGRAVRAVLGQFDRLRLKAVATGAAITSALGAVVGGALFRSAIGSAADFEAQLDRVQAASGATGPQLDQLREKFEAVGQSTRFTATEAAAAGETLAKAGFDASEIANTLDGVINLSIVANQGLAESAGQLNTVLATYQLESSKAVEVTDLLVAASNGANTSTTNLAFGIAGAGTQAAAAGVSLERLVGSLALVQSRGLSAEKSTTAVLRAIEELSDPTSDVNDLLNSLGLATGDFETGLNSIANAGPNTAKVMRSLSAESRLAVQILASDGPDAAKKFIESLGDIDGAAAATAKTIGDNFNGAIKGLQSALDAARRFLVEPILKPLTEDVKAFSKQVLTAIQDGSLDEFRTAIKNTFDRGRESVKAFIKEFNFRDASTAIGEFVSTTSDRLGGLIEFVDGFAKAISTGFNVILTGVRAIGTAYSAIFDDVDTFRRKQAQLDEQIEKTRIESTQLKEQLFGTGDAYDAAGDAADRAADKAKNNSDATAKNTAELQKLEQVALPVYEAVEGKVIDLSEKLSIVPGQVKAIGDETEATGEKADEAVKKIGDIEAAFDGSIESVKAVTEAIEESNNKRDEARRLAREQAAAERDVADAAEDTADAQEDAADAANEAGRAQIFISQQTADSLRRAAELQQQLTDATGGTTVEMQQAEAAARAFLSDLRGIEAGSTLLDPLRNALADIENRFNRVAEDIRRLQDEQELIDAEAAGRGEEARIDQERRRRLEELAELREQASADQLAALSELENAAERNAQRDLERLRERRREEQNAGAGDQDGRRPRSGSGGQAAAARGGLTLVADIDSAQQRLHERELARLREREAAAESAGAAARNAEGEFERALSGVNLADRLVEALEPRRVASNRNRRGGLAG